jgi:hypothetical protein
VIDDKYILDAVNDIINFLISDIVVYVKGKWIVCHIRADHATHDSMYSWCTDTLGKQHRGIKTGMFKLFTNFGRWQCDQHDLDILTGLGTRRCYWFRHANDFEMFKLVWFDEITR